MRQRESGGRPSRRVGHRREGARLLQTGPVTDGPSDDHGPAHDRLLRDGAAELVGPVITGVGGVAPVVTQYEQATLGHLHLEGEVRRFVAGVDVGLGQGRAVHGHPALCVAALDRVAADPDDPLDQVLLVVGRQQADEGQPLLELLDDHGVVLLLGLLGGEPASGVLEDDDVTALGLGAEPRGELVHQDAVADLDRVLHGARRDHEGLHQEGLEDQGYQHGHADEEGYLLDGRAPPAPLDLAGELAPLDPARPGGASGGAPGAGGQQVVGGAGGDPARPSTVTHGHLRRRAPAHRRRDASAGSSGPRARRSSRPGR